jgi:SnoaL-like domain
VRPDDLARETVRAIEWDCAQLLTRFFNAFDQWHYDDMAAIFAPGGVRHRAGQSLKGEAILTALNKRSRTQTVRHVVTNVQVDVRDTASADFLLYVTAYRHDSGTKPEKPPKIASPYLLLVVPGTLVRIGEDWRIASMTMNREFEF